MKLLPFDLEKAQSGHPWGTRDGRKGKKIFDTERENSSRLIAVLDNEAMLTFDIRGNYHNEESTNDLFLYEEKKKGWVVIIKDKSSPYGFIVIKYINEDDKNNYEEICKNEGIYLKTVEVEY